MRYRRTALNLAAGCALILAAAGTAPGAVSAEPRARAQALEPACDSPGTGQCYFEWFDRSGNRTVELDPEIDVCYNSAASAIRGTNRTNRVVLLWPRANCRDSATALVASGRSWNDPTQPYFSYKPVR
ncbi:hypothetical protein [Streptomyces hiroshimensis]|uniref:Peptidase inhibitor family I36 n=1 Tax=Streptomyces hiroshimensis TaxID=66424 RepID=A0ABQ2Y8C8_9ACTN|nr:hypothetical protein [Streptomyces hiroshimensis]GGX74739.1 hypothetical protein GCM10010324_20120 [Streptomyces hiroshimensis]